MPEQTIRYDVTLFRSLNEEYRTKPLTPNVKKNHEASALIKNAAVRATRICDSHGLAANSRILEIGCGNSHMARALAALGHDVTGVDICSRKDWHGPSNLRFVEADLSKAIPDDLGTFDFIFSSAVFEHVRHPFAMLQAARSLLRDGGQFYLKANLYRGPKASHRYREIHFPWPHILFADEVFEDYYISIGQPPRRPAWINQLTIADYFRYFDLVGFKVKQLSYATTPIDEPFYNRFADKLERFPRYDLERDFIIVTLAKADHAQAR